MTLQFADYLSLEAFALAREYKRRYPFPQELLQKYGQDNQYDTIWYAAQRNVRRTLVMHAITRYVAARHRLGLLYPIDNGYGRSTSFAIEWDIAMTGRDNPAITRFLANIINEYDRPSDDSQVTARIWNRLCEFIDAGNFEWDQVNQSQTCFKTGVVLCVEFENWRPYYGLITYNGAGRLVDVVRAPMISQNS